MFKCIDFDGILSVRSEIQIHSDGLERHGFRKSIEIKVQSSSHNSQRNSVYRRFTMKDEGVREVTPLQGD